MISFNKEDIFLIVGASSGIGKSTALLLNTLNATVVIVGRNINKLKDLQNESFNCNNVHIEVRDIQDDIDGNTCWIKEMARKYGKFRGIVLSAGISIERPLELIEHKTLISSQDLLFNSYITIIKGFASKQVHNANSSIVILSSNAAHYGTKAMLEYSSIKAALITACKVLANELFKKHIRVNTVSPGLINTAMAQNAIISNSEEDMQHAGMPEDVANLIIFLLSDKSRWITAQDIVIDGGNSLPKVHEKFSSFFKA